MTGAGGAELFGSIDAGSKFKLIHAEPRVCARGVRSGVPILAIITLKLIPYLSFLVSPFIKN